MEASGDQTGSESSLSLTVTRSTSLPSGFIV